MRKALQIELKRIQESVGITFVYVTHDQEEALAMSDRVAVMNDGQIEQLAPPQEIYDRPATEFVARVHRRHELHPGDRTAASPSVPSGSGWPARATGFEADVVTRMMIGPTVQCVVRLEDGQEVLVRLQRSDGLGRRDACGTARRSWCHGPTSEALELTGGRTA